MHVFICFVIILPSFRPLKIKTHLVYNCIQCNTLLSRQYVMLENFLLESNSHTQYKNLNKLHVDQYQHNQHIRIMQNITAVVTHNKDTFTYKFYSFVFVGQLISRERQTKKKLVLYFWSLKTLIKTHSGTKISTYWRKCRRGRGLRQYLVACVGEIRNAKKVCRDRQTWGRDWKNGTFPNTTDDC